MKKSGRRTQAWSSAIHRSEVARLKQEQESNGCVPEFRQACIDSGEIKNAQATKTGRQAQADGRGPYGMQWIGSRQGVGFRASGRPAGYAHVGSDKSEGS